MFNIDEYLKTLEAPAYQLDGKTYTGRILSIEEWLPFAESFDRLTDGSMTVPQQMAFARRYLRAVYPKRFSMRWVGDPVDMIMASPALWQVVADFFGCQVRAISGKRLTETKTHGHDLNESPANDLSSNAKTGVTMVDDPSHS